MSLVRWLPWAAFSSALVSLALGCGGSVGGNAGPCASDDPPPECQLECTVDNDTCPDYFYCGPDGACTADCTPTGGECPDGQDCNLDGKCEPDDGCPDVTVNLTPITPTVVLLIDQSGSMTQGFGDTDRWDAVRVALTDPTDGVLPKLDDRLILGATLYTYDGAGACPDLLSVAPALNNADAVAQLLNDNDPINHTPTAESIDAVVAAFPAAERRVLVLATDGNPDTCADPDSNDQLAPRTTVEERVAAAYALGITTYVLSVGADAEQEHLARVARLGQGQDAATGDATAFLANNQTELAAAFGAIVGGATSCDIDINGTVALDRAGEGTVVLNGDILDFGVDWQMLDENTLQLIGQACEDYLLADEATLSGEWPCGGVVVE